MPNDQKTGFWDWLVRIGVTALLALAGYEKIHPGPPPAPAPAPFTPGPFTPAPLPTPGPAPDPSGSPLARAAARYQATEAATFRSLADGVRSGAIRDRAGIEAAFRQHSAPMVDALGRSLASLCGPDGAIADPAAAAALFGEVAATLEPR